MSFDLAAPRGPHAPSPPVPLAGTEAFRGADGATVLDFWRYALPDLRTDTTRGLLAEFLVHRAVGAPGRNAEWESFDVGQWHFYVAARASVEGLGQASAGLAAVEKICGDPVTYFGLGHRITVCGAASGPD